MTGKDATAVLPAEQAAGTPQDTRSAALCLLAAAALLILLVCVLLVAFGTSEALETRQWIIAFAIALPGGAVIASRQGRDLDEARAAWAVAAATVVLGAALTVCRVIGTEGTLPYALVGIAAAAALAAPWLVRRIDPPSTAAGHVTAIVALAITTLLFVPAVALRADRLAPALALAVIALAALLVTAHRELPRTPRRALDVVLAGVLALVVMSIPDIRPIAYVLVHHHDFYLGPVNAVLHGRAMLDGTWSQYGIGVMDLLALAFHAVPLGYGGMALIVGALTAAQYALVYATLRMAIASQLLVVAILAADVVPHILGADFSYLTFPSTSPLRFGLPYVVIALAVRYAGRAPRARKLQILVVAISAAWSFETFTYTAATFGLVVVATELAAGEGALWRIVRAAVGAAASAIAAVLVYTGLTAALTGGAAWGPYVEYLKLYSVAGFGQLPVPFFSPGPVMGAVIFLSVAATIHLARTRSEAATPQQLAALAGFGGAALSFFTYYLGRSHPSNLVNIMLPVVALGGLWAAVALRGRASPARISGLAALLTAGAMLVVMGWPAAKTRWQDTAFAQAIPYADGKPAGQGGSLTFALKRLWHQPAFDARAVTGVAVLKRHLPAGAPALVITEPDLTTEILIRSGRRNLIPINNPIEDNLIRSTAGRVRDAIEDVPAGTLLLTSPAPKVRKTTGPIGGPRDFVRVQVLALALLHKRFRFEPVAVTPDGLQLFRLLAVPTGATVPRIVPQGRSTP